MAHTILGASLRNANAAIIGQMIGATIENTVLIETSAGLLSMVGIE
jgi:hypothetical protein